MGQNVALSTKDGHTLSGYVAEPSGTPKGGVIVIQEIFGVNNHVRNLVDMFAGHGYLAVGPALFDRIEPGIELGYNETDFAAAREHRGPNPAVNFPSPGSGEMQAVKGQPSPRRRSSSAVAAGAVNARMRSSWKKQMKTTLKSSNRQPGNQLRTAFQR